MHRRINISLPEHTVSLLDRVAPRGDRSQLIAEAMQAPVPVFEEPIVVLAAPVVDTTSEQPTADPSADYLTNYSPEPVESMGIQRVEGADMAALMREHRTTLIFVNTRRMAERSATHTTGRCSAAPV